jgi:hypothetical protein
MYYLRVNTLDPRESRDQFCLDPKSASPDGTKRHKSTAAKHTHTHTHTYAILSEHPTYIVKYTAHIKFSKLVLLHGVCLDSRKTAHPAPPRFQEQDWTSCQSTRLIASRLYSERSADHTFSYLSIGWFAMERVNYPQEGCSTVWRCKGRYKLFSTGVCVRTQSLRAASPTPLSLDVSKEKLDYRTDIDDGLRVY